MKDLPFVVLFSLLVCFSCKRGETQFKDIHTGVLFEGEEIIMADRNLGADHPGDDGTYVSWQEAVKACPKGYRLMSFDEAKVFFSDERYNTGQKLHEGELRFPYAGWASKGTGSRMNYQSRGEWGDYHLNDEYDDDQSWYVQFDSDSEHLQLEFLGKNDLLSVRCIKAPERGPYRIQVKAEFLLHHGRSSVYYP